MIFQALIYIFKVLRMKRFAVLEAYNRIDIQDSLGYVLFNE